ncbi:hypothetical protein BOTBODRAFT_423746 [Botryobasidium botryosum FD-172 SS1]|uniref:Uncharacterized protein n=1 Tax=Botryobasidium botryosum (strain FD-172 SS1) TaxID=930990 RepID=A0A067MCI3_BOTB1|nr:hypothetical protein BOTBODRAFT_423746 [Botryobasidium botryosum FD-172 SS1]
MKCISIAGPFLALSIPCTLFFLLHTNVTLAHSNPTSPAPLVPLTPTTANHTVRRVEGRWASVRASLELPPLPDTIDITHHVPNHHTSPKSPPTRASFKSRIRADLRRRKRDHDSHASYPALYFAPDALMIPKPTPASSRPSSADPDQALVKSSYLGGRGMERYRVLAGRGKARRMN